MAKVWKKLQRADGDFQGTWDGVAKGNVYHTANKPTKGDVGLGNVTNHAAYHSGNKPTKSDVGLGNVDNVQQYSANNKPTKGDVGLGNVTNESKATMFASPTFTGTPSGISKSHVGLGNVGNTSVADIRAGVTKSDVGLGNVDNSKFGSGGEFKGKLQKSDGTDIFDTSDGNFTGKIGGTAASTVESRAKDAKDAVDGNASITVVGGTLSIGTPSSGIYPFRVDNTGHLKMNGDEFEVTSTGEVSCKGDFTIKQDSNGDSQIILEGDASGTALVEVNGANPHFNLGGSSPLGTATLDIKRTGTGNQARIFFYNGSTKIGCIGFANKPDDYETQFAIHTEAIYDNSSPYKERALSFDADGKMGMYANTKTVSGFTFGTDGTNKHVYIKDGSLGVNRAPSDTWKADINGNVRISDTLNLNDGTYTGQLSLNANGYTELQSLGDRSIDIKSQRGINFYTSSNGSSYTEALDLSYTDGSATFASDVDVGGELSVQGSTSGISYDDLEDKPTLTVSDNSITLAKMADNAIRVAELDTQNTPTSGQFLQHAPSGTGLYWTTVPHMSSDGLYLDRANNDSYIVFQESGTQYGQIRSAKDDGGGIKVTASGGSTIWSQWKSDGNHEFEKGIIVKGTAVTGWHTKDTIWIPPSEFVINDDNAYGNLAMVDNGGQGKVMYSNMEAYANIPIPSGYQASKFRINGTASVVIGAYYSDITTSTATSCSPPSTIYTNTEYSFYQSPVNADDSDGRYIILKWNPTTTSQYLYGAYIKLLRI